MKWLQANFLESDRRFRFGKREASYPCPIGDSQLSPGKLLLPVSFRFIRLGFHLKAELVGTFAVSAHTISLQSVELPEHLLSLVVFRTVHLSEWTSIEYATSGRVPAFVPCTAIGHRRSLPLKANKKGATVPT